MLQGCTALLAGLRQVPFWSIFYPWVLGYLGFYFLRGGSGAEGLLANIRDLLWIPITQDAYRCGGAFFWGWVEWGVGGI